MKKLKVLVALSLVALLATPALAANTIKIGYNIPMTGDIPKVGEMSKQAAEMLKADINGAGGLEVGGKKYMLEFVYEDNEAKAESAVNHRPQADRKRRSPRDDRPELLEAGRTGRPGRQRQRNRHGHSLVDQP